MTPYELLYLLLSELNYPDVICGYKVIYCKLCMDCDIIVPDDVSIELKIQIMKQIIKKLGNVKINRKITKFQKYEVEKKLRLF